MADVSRRSHLLTVRMADDEFEALRVEAEADGINMSDWIRRQVRAAAKRRRPVVMPATSSRREPKLELIEPPVVRLRVVEPGPVCPTCQGPQPCARTACVLEERRRAAIRTPQGPAPR